MLANFNTHYIQPMRTFNREARLFLLMTIIYGIILSGWQLFFNIYMLQNGFQRDFLGIVNSVPSLTGLLLGIPIGRLTDRIGGRRSLILGIICCNLAFLGQVIFQQPVVIIFMSALTGLFTMVIIVSESPLMMRLSNSENRTMLFSLNFGLQTLAGAAGSLFAGRMPAVFGSLLNVGHTSAAAYQAVLITTVLLGTTALIPLWMMKDTKTLEATTVSDEQTAGSESGSMRYTLKLATPNFLVGMGAAVLIPYMNVFFKDQYAISDASMGLLFGLSSLFVGIGSFVGPRLTVVLGGKIRTIAMTQLASVVFLLIVGFSGSLWIAAIAFLFRGALMNMSAPLYSAFCMEQTPERQHGFMSSVLNIAWQIGWSVGPYISGLVQQSYGFTPLFISTTILYVTAIGYMWFSFHGTENQAPG